MVVTQNINVLTLLDTSSNYSQICSWPLAFLDVAHLVAETEITVEDPLTVFAVLHNFCVDS